MVVRIAGSRMYLWRAVDDEGEVLDMLVQRRRDKRAALRLMRKLHRKPGFAPKLLTTRQARLLWGGIPAAPPGLPMPREARPAWAALRPSGRYCDNAGEVLLMLGTPISNWTRRSAGKEEVSAATGVDNELKRLQSERIRHKKRIFRASSAASHCWPLAFIDVVSQSGHTALLLYSATYVWLRNFPAKPRPTACCLHRPA